MFKSNDNGTTWEEISSPPPIIDARNISDNIIIGFYGSNNGYYRRMYRSTDNGITWVVPMQFAG